MHSAKKASKKPARPRSQKIPANACGPDTISEPNRNRVPIEASAIYTDEVVAQIAKKAGINAPELIGELQDFLVDAAKKYAATLNMLSKVERLRTLKETFDNLNHAIGSLEDALAAMSDEERWRLWDENWNISEAPAVAFQAYPIMNIPAEYPEEKAFVAMLAKLNARAQLMCEGLAKSSSPGGRPRDYPVLDWIVRIRDFWTDRLDRKFTYSAINNDPKSPAFKFCHDAIKPLVPDIKKQDLVTAMRTAIKQMPVRFVIGEPDVKDV